jgi:hypothetical protein
MHLSRKLSLGAALGTAMLTAGAFGYMLFSPSTSGAQTTTTVPAATGGATTTVPSSAGSSGTGTFHSNEDPTHEKGESAQRETDENSGKAFAGHDGGGQFRPNEDPTHEKSESTQREAQENAGRVPTTP